MLAALARPWRGTITHHTLTYTRYTHRTCSTTKNTGEKKQYRGSMRTGEAPEDFWKHERVAAFVNGEQFAVPSSVEPHLPGFTPRPKKQIPQPPKPTARSYVPDELLKEREHQDNPKPDIDLEFDTPLLFDDEISDQGLGDERSAQHFGINDT